MVTGPAITAFSSEVISTAELMVAGFLSIPDKVLETWPVIPLLSVCNGVKFPWVKLPDPCLFLMHSPIQKP